MRIRTPRVIKTIKKKVPRVHLSDSSRAIIGVLGGLGIVTLMATFPGLAYAVGPFVEGKRKRTKVRVERNLESLVRAGLVKQTKNRNGEVCIALTSKGRFEALLTHKTVTKHTKKWDGKWRIVVFDVPNTETKLRNELRRSMKLFGFLPLQKSVWVYPYNCDDFMVLLKEHLGISRDVLYLEASYIENDEHLREEFGFSEEVRR